MMREYTKWAFEVRLFDSVDELVRAVKAVPEHKAAPCQTYRRPDLCGRDFRSWQDVYTAVTTPWQEGLDEVERMAAAIAGVELPEPVCRLRRNKWAEDDGYDIDLDRLRSGQPYWRTAHRPLASGEQVVTIAIDVNARIGITSKDILWRGAAALAMTRILEDAGYRVELWLAHRADEVYTDGWGHLHAVRLKEAQDNLDLSTVTSAVSGWFYRSILQRAKTLSGRTMTAGKGRPYPPMSLVDELGVADLIIIGDTYSFSGAVQAAREALQKLASPPPAKELPEEPLEEVRTAMPASPPPKPLTPAQQRREQQEREAAHRRYVKLAKAWEAQNRDD